MKLLITTDFHGEKRATRHLKNFLKKDYDILLILGDITQFGPPKQAEEILDLAKDTEISTYALPGNCDPKELVSILEKKEMNLHSKVETFDEFSIAGLGASNPTPFNTPFELSEKEILEKLKKLTQEVKDTWILATHAPPYDTKADLTSSGDHAGSESIRKIIEEKEPILNVCGHIHEARSIDIIGSTKIVNPGPIMNGKAVELSIERGDVDISLL